MLGKRRKRKHLEDRERALEMKGLEIGAKVWYWYRHQVEALRLMVNEGEEMTNRQYREMFDISYRTAARDLNGLVDLGQARQIGQGRSTSYVAV